MFKLEFLESSCRSRLSLCWLFAIWLFAFLFLLGCQDKWYFEITEFSDPSHPRFCLSHREGCRGQGIKPPGLAVHEVNERGEYIREMWIVEYTKDTYVKEVTYGITPEGYKEKVKAIPLEIDKLYAIQGGVYYFRLLMFKGKVISEVYSDDQFYKEFRRGAVNTKTEPERGQNETK